MVHANIKIDLAISCGEDSSIIRGQVFRTSLQDVNAVDSEVRIWAVVVLSFSKHWRLSLAVNLLQYQRHVFTWAEESSPSCHIHVNQSKFTCLIESGNQHQSKVPDRCVALLSHARYTFPSFLMLSSYIILDSLTSIELVLCPYRHWRPIMGLLLYGRLYTAQYLLSKHADRSWIDIYGDDVLKLNRNSYHCSRILKVLPITHSFKRWISSWNWRNHNSGRCSGISRQAILHSVSSTSYVLLVFSPILTRYISPTRAEQQLRTPCASVVRTHK